MRWLALFLAACSYQVDYPTTLVLTHEFTEAQVVELEAAAAQWNERGAHLRVAFGRLDAVDLEQGLTPVRPAILFGRVGLTSHLGVQIDIVQLERHWYWVPGALQRAAAHEFGHVLGLGPPADGAEHIATVGDVMCGQVECIMMGTGELSDTDIEAWRSGGSR